MQAITTDIAIRIKLTKKQRLDNPEHSTRAVYSLEFTAPDGIFFKGGDLLMIKAGDGKLRPYSIGSSASIGNILRLTVGLEQKTMADGSVVNSVGAEYLINQLTVGNSIDVYLRHHTKFNLPENGQEPVIMAATGTGIAPILGLMEDAKIQGRQTWLFWGNGHQLGDDYYQEFWAQHQQQGTLKHFNQVFDSQESGYIQDHMIADGQEIYRWLTEEHALFYFCGRANTIGQGVEFALKEIYQQQTAENEAMAEKWLESLYQNGQMNADLFG